MADLQIDTDATRGQAALLRQAAARLGLAHDNLVRELDSIGQCWGNPADSQDQVAQAFAKDYVPPRDNIVQGCQDTAEAITQIADRVDRAMRGYEDVEQGNTRLAARTPREGGSTPAARGA